MAPFILVQKKSPYTFAFL